MPWTERWLGDAYVRRWDFGARSGREGGALMNGVSALIKGAPRRPLKLPTT